MPFALITLSFYFIASIIEDVQFFWVHREFFTVSWTSLILFNHVLVHVIVVLIVDSRVRIDWYWYHNHIARLMLHLDVVVTLCVHER